MNIKFSYGLLGSGIEYVTYNLKQLHHYVKLLHA